MTIAVSVFVRPSRILAYVLISLVLLINIIMLIILYSLAMGVIILAVFALIAGVVSSLILWRFHRTQISCHLSVVDSGELLLRDFHSATSVFDSKKVMLSKRSTLWQQMLLLHLCAEDGSEYVVVILRDSIDKAAFRPLLAALRWVSLRTSSKNVLNQDVLHGNF